MFLNACTCDEDKTINDSVSTNRFTKFFYFHILHFVALIRFICVSSSIVFSLSSCFNIHYTARNDRLLSLDGGGGGGYDDDTGCHLNSMGRMCFSSSSDRRRPLDGGFVCPKQPLSKSVVDGRRGNAGKEAAAESVRPLVIGPDTAPTARERRVRRIRNACAVANRKGP